MMRSTGEAAVMVGLTGAADTGNANVFAYAYGWMRAGPKVCTISSTHV
jgi:hypothetical protein